VKLFLTGGTGFIGRRLTRRLLEGGWAVTALVRRPDGAEAQKLASMGARLAQGDVTERESMRAPMGGAEVVVHNAGWYEVGLTGQAGRRMQAINVDGTANTLGLAAELGIPRIVHVSSVVATGDTGGIVADESFRRRAPATSVYELTKAQAHAIAELQQRRGDPVVIVSPAAVLGPGDHSPWGYVMKLWVRGIFPPVFWSPESRYSFIYLDDVAEGIALAAEQGRPGASYLLSAGSLSIREIMGLLERTPGGQRVRLYLPPVVAAPLMEATVAPLLRLAGFPAFISREAVLGSSGDMNYTGALAERELGLRYLPPEEAWRRALAAEREALPRP
jgi:nucleoside-diphosphate-sugar epimerase